MNKELALSSIYEDINHNFRQTELHKSMAVLHAKLTGAAISTLMKTLGIKKGTGGSGDRDKGLSTALAINCPEIPIRTAYDYLNFYEKQDDVSLESISAQLRYISSPEPVKEIIKEKVAVGESVGANKIQELNKKHKEELARTAEANKAAFIKTTNLYDVKLVDLNKQYQQTLKEKNALDQQVANLRNNTADPLHEPKVKTELAKLAAKIAQRDGELFKLNKEMTVQSVELEKAQEWIKNNAVIAQKYSKEISELKHTLGIAQKALHNAEVNAKIKSFGAAVDDLAKVADPNIKKAKLEIIRLQNQIESKESELKDISKNTDVQFVIQKLKAIELLTASSKPIEFYTNLIEQLS
jgi:hypothetical protein